MWHMHSEGPLSLDEWMDDRRTQLRLGWDAVATQAGITRQTLFNLRRGGGSHTATRRSVERVLRWESRSIDAILAGGQPTPIEKPEEQIRQMSLDDLADAFAELARDRPDHEVLEAMARVMRLRSRPDSPQGRNAG